MEQAGLVRSDRSATMDTFGKRLKKARMEKKMSIRQLSERTGINHVTLFSYEIEEHEPRLFFLVCLADVLDVSIDWLAGRSEVSWLA